MVYLKEKLLTDERVFGAKPHSLLGMIIFSNGFTGLFILFRREFKNFIKTIFEISSFWKLNISKMVSMKFLNSLLNKTNNPVKPLENIIIPKRE